MKALDLSYSFRDDLRSWPNNPSDMALFVENERESLKAFSHNTENVESIREHCKRLGESANYLKTLRRVDESLKLFEEIDGYIRRYDLGARTLLVNNLRRADVLRYKNDFNSAREIFEKCLLQINETAALKDYKDFALQHLGKLHFDMQNYRKALDFFYEALEVRKIKNEPDLLDSTLLAIRITESKI